MAQRQGFTMVELLLTLVLGMVIMGAAYEAMLRQSDAYRMFDAMSATQQDIRTGADLLGSELRELSSSGADLVMATPDSLRFRALRKFGLLCDKNKISKKIVVAQTGLESFVPGDSLLIYVDGDTLQAEDDAWRIDYVNNTSLSVACGTTLGISLATLLPSANLIELTTGSAALKYDSIFPGAPVRSFEMLTYRTGTVGGQTLLVRARGNAVAPLVGPLAATNGFRLRYFDELDNELTAFPLSAADRASVRRIEVQLDAVRPTRPGERYQDRLTTDVYLRGS